MNRFLQLCLLVILPFSKVVTQNKVPEGIMTCSALIEMKGSSGSGFFIQDSSDIFFVSARHVLMNSNTNPRTKGIEYSFKAPLIQVRWYPRKVERDEANLMIINVASLKASGNLRYGEKVEDDFIIMRIGSVEQKEGYGAIVYGSAITRPGTSSRLDGIPINKTVAFKETIIGHDIIMVGYPKSLGLKSIPQYDFNRPLIRKGIIAGKNTTLKNIVVDCPSFGGNSGGAIFEIINHGLSWEFKLTGIVSSFIPLEESWINPNYGIKNIEFANSGYSVAIPIEKAISQIDSIKVNPLN